MKVHHSIIEKHKNAKNMWAHEDPQVIVFLRVYNQLNVRVCLESV
jgi:hypothetical protein